MNATLRSPNIYPDSQVYIALPVELKNFNVFGTVSRIDMTVFVEAAFIGLAWFVGAMMLNFYLGYK